MFTTHEENLDDFAAARFGLFVHFGLYSLLERGEWVLNRERIPVDEYRQLRNRFTAEGFDADGLCRLAVEAGCRYVCLTTMHHDGFSLYESKANPFCVAESACGRDLVGEFVRACRDHGLRVHLYHSLNHWTSTPHGADALEDGRKAKAFVDFAHDRLVELVKRYRPIDCVWYDGWWPFDAQGWRAEEMNNALRRVQPHLIFNGRNGLDGDFATPEGHVSAPYPYQPWEACVTHNQNWGFHAGDHCYKTDAQVLSMLCKAAAGGGNLMINVGLDGQGRVPRQATGMLKNIGSWLRMHGEAIYGSEPMLFNLRSLRDGDRSDWTMHGHYTAKGNQLYVILTNWPGHEMCVAGLQTTPRSVRLLHSESTLNYDFDPAADGRLIVKGLPACPPHELGGVVAVECDERPCLYLTGGTRNPLAEHPRYDPVESDIIL